MLAYNAAMLIQDAIACCSGFLSLSAITRRVAQSPERIQQQVLAHWQLAPFRLARPQPAQAQPLPVICTMRAGI